MVQGAIVQKKKKLINFDEFFQGPLHTILFFIPCAIIFLYHTIFSEKMCVMHHIAFYFQTMCDCRISHTIVFQSVYDWYFVTILEDWYAIWGLNILICTRAGTWARVSRFDVEANRSWATPSLRYIYYIILEYFEVIDGENVRNLRWCEVHSVCAILYYSIRYKL